MVPACLTAACPSLRTLRLTLCTLQAPGEGQQQQQQGEVTFPPHLHALHVHNSDIVPLQVLATTLAALPSLTTLAVRLADRSPYSCDDMTTVLSALVGQLTQFEFVCSLHDKPSAAPFFTTPAVLDKLSKLQRLDIRRTILHDTCLSVLLERMPTLTHVSVHSAELQNSHADVGCSWEELSMYSVTVTSLAHLPLRGIKRVCVRQLAGSAAAGADGEAAATQLTAALVAAPGCAFIGSEWVALKCRVDEMPLLLPLLLARWKGNEMFHLSTPFGECLTPAAVGALRALLEGMPSCTHLAIKGLTPHPSVQLLPVLVRTHVSKLWLLHRRMTEAHLVLWCAGGQASRPITVELQEDCAFEGNIDNVRSTVSVPGSGVVLEDSVYDAEATDDDEVDDVGLHG